MRTIEIERDLRVRFPQQHEGFDDGFEVGLIAAQMGAGVARARREIDAGVINQVEALAKSLSYRVRVVERTERRATVEIERTGLRPSLRVVSTEGRVSTSGR